MNPDNTVEYNSLSWVKAQLDDVLSDAQSNLNEYIENQKDELLENCIENLQLIYGTLQMVEVYGGAILSEEMQKTTAALLEGNVERAEDTYDVLMRAMLQLPDYLEKIQAGNKDAPITLMPLINDLRAARKEGLLTESVLFSPDLENAKLVAIDYDAEAIKPGKLQDEAKRLRTHYQLGLLDYIRNNKERAGLQRIKAVLSSLEKVSSNDEVRRIWMVIGALVEGLIKQGIDTNISIKMLLGSVDRQLKLILDVGEEDFTRQYSKELMKNVLYYVGLCSVESKSISAVKQAYQLSELIPQETDGSAAEIGGLNADLFDTVSKGITEDLNNVKDVLELFMHSSEQDLEQLVPVVDQLGKIADTYGMLGMGAVRQSIKDQCDVMESMISGDTEISEQVVLDIASELLNSESELKDYIASRSGFIDMNRSTGDQAVPAAEYRQVVHTVVSEGLKNFSVAKEAILSYIAGIGDKEQLEIILQRLEEVRGVTMLLPMARVETLVIKLQNYIRVALLNNHHQADESEQDTVADVVTSIEYFFEALSEGRPGVEQGLNAGEDAANKLEKITQSYGDSVQITSEVEEAAAVSDKKSQETASNKEISIEEFKPEVAVTAAIVEPQDVEQFSILSDDADEEIVEIFIEEAVEVLGELHTYLPKWEANNDDEESLAVVRRSFHTLKGSGRLLGANLIGEFSWKFENLLNRIIDKKINVSDDLIHALDEALAVLPQLIEQLKGNREPIKNISQLMTLADTLSEGGEASFEATEEKVAEKSTEEIIIEEEELTDTEVINIEDATVEVDEDINLVIDENEIEDEVVVAFDLSDDVDVQEDVISLDADELLEEGSDISNVYDIEIEEGDNTVVASDDAFDIDPMLLKIYHDESKTHIEDVIQLLDECKTNDQALKADKILMRAFHTLYGSARTAEVEAIANLSGAVEKYIKTRQESEEEYIPENVTAVIRDIGQAIEQMLAIVSEGKLPTNNKNLQERINKVVQQEIQQQLQKSWHDDSSPAEEINISDLSVDDIDVEAIAVDDKDTEVSLEDETQASVADEPVLMSYGDIDDELIDIFLEEAEELLENCEGTLNKIIAEPDSAEHIRQLQRNMHTLKGGARMADLTPIGNLTHNLESLVVMVDDKKVTADKTVFDLLQESLDILTTMLASVKKRQSLVSASDLNNRIEMIMRGEVVEKRSVERFDVDLSELEPTDVDEPEDIDISDLLPESSDETDTVQDVTAETGTVEDVSKQEPEQNEPEQLEAEQQEPEQPVAEEPHRRKDDKEKEQPHWGERATDINYKESQEQVRVRADLLNNLVNYAGEVNIHHARMGKQITDFGFNLSELTQTVVRLKEQLRKLEIETEIQIRSGYEKEADNFDDSFDPLEMDQYSTMQQLTRSLSETAGDVESINEILTDITRDSETLLLQEARISTDLQEGLMRTRMVRFGGLSSRLRRIVRQVSRELGKEVEVDIVGESIEVDRTVLDRIIAPLEHILRNAVAHGIETPEARKVLSKNETGKISIEVDRQGTDIVINVKDDGAGINVDKVREKAIKQGYIEADSDLSDHDILQFILQSGFSTADEVTQVAGRGVGMDVVDSEIKQLGGVLNIDTRHGMGTEFDIRLPLTLAINQALLVKTSDDIFAVPLTSIEGVVRVTGLELQRFYDSDNSHYEFNGVEYELKHLGGLLTGNQPDYSKQLLLYPVLLVHVGDQHFALHVDDLIGRREIVIKPVGMQIGAVRGIAGATILADGRVVLILEMSALVVAESLFKPHIPVEVEAEQAVADDKISVMVIDDSITIRKVTERMLLRHGIEVVLAKDGVDATNQLQDHIPDLMLLDIEMPRMDGFEVASYVRNDERLKNVPIIMITSRTGSKHKEKAMKIGVNRYLGKPFQEDDLVNNINEILHTTY
jgi:chemosensory pili system protein ChpA (sensor histidine kinase/response regulator)